MTKTVKPGTDRERIPTPGLGRRLIGMALLFVALVSMATLSWHHLRGTQIPGCGPGSACDQATRSAWGAIPGLDWPVAYLGTAFFAGLLIAWVFSGLVSREFRTLVRLGGFVSLAYAVIIVATRLSCPYCLAAHAANFLFWILVETTRQRVELPNRCGVIALAGFLSVTMALGVAEWQARDSARQNADRSAQESTAAIIAATSQRASTIASPQNSDSAATQPGSAAAAPVGKPFLGRYRRGPEKAAIRIVVCSDFQCPSCKQVDGELDAIVKSRPDVSLTMKHFPMCLDCNKYAGRTMHANACWAARAAEAAGILKGNDGFWTLHDVLFARGGNFLNSQQLREMIEPLGVEFADFERTMKSPEALERVQSDIEECMAIGMRYTPMVLINGVEFRGWERQGAIREAVDKLAATNPPALGPEADLLPPAADRLARLWMNEPVQGLPPSVWRHALGPENSALRVVVFGDYQEPSVARVDAYLRSRAEAGEIRYAFAHYPTGKDCNPALPKTVHPQGCWAAKMAEGAGLLGGDVAYWKAHAWLMEHQSEFNDDAMASAVGEWGIEIGALREAATRSESLQSIAAGIEAGKSLKLTAVPWIVVNERVVPIWEYQGENLLPRILVLAQRSP